MGYSAHHAQLTTLNSWLKRRPTKPAKRVYWASNKIWLHVVGNRKENHKTGKRSEVHTERRAWQLGRDILGSATLRARLTYVKIPAWLV